MAKKTQVVEEDELEELEELEELDDSQETEAASSSGSDMLTAKQVATLLGTDGRTLRKFLRSKFGILGQGNRWEIDPTDVPALKAEFAKSGKKEPKVKEPKADKPKTTATPRPSSKKLPPADDLEADDDDEDAGMTEPTQDELDMLEELDEIEDLDELD